MIGRGVVMQTVMKFLVTLIGTKKVLQMVTVLEDIWMKMIHPSFTRITARMYNFIEPTKFFNVFYFKLSYSLDYGWIKRSCKTTKVRAICRLDCNGPNPTDEPTTVRFKVIYPKVDLILRKKLKMKILET